MILAPVLVDVRNAYESRDRDGLERALKRLQGMLITSGKSPVRHLDPPALQMRRSEVAAELNAVDAEIQRRQQPTD